MELNKIRAVVNNHDLWKLLDLYLEELYNSRHKEMDNFTKIEDIYRAQGYCQAIKTIRALKERANANQN